MKAKAKVFSILLILTIFFSGCVVFSFYPLYTEDDLFENDLLTGTWVDDEETVWTFTHPLKDKNNPDSEDKTSYKLIQKYKDSDKGEGSEFKVVVIKLDENYFIDFYLVEYGNDDPALAEFHLIPVHTFAKAGFENGKININWFDQDWLEKLIKQNKIRIHHEKNDDFILLTAKPQELQKFVTKYVNSEEAFEDGLAVELTRE
ncbi:MAG: hypothetical protein JXR31_16490 [Prolixibacteraceae bacterium]|nr:hypothetical protein [Prolixibacteraceae bacterium]MBN2775856.1 hypothetical protein [Prolixibacteraceae bacterium]